MIGSAYLSLISASLFKAQDVKSQVIHACFNVRPPDAATAKKRAENIKGNPITIAQNFDKSQVRKLNSLVRLNACNYVDVTDRINRNAQYRTSLAEYLINIACYYNPAQFALSRHCKLALTLARQLGEIPMADHPQGFDLPEFDDI